MPNLNMNGPYNFNLDTINKIISEKKIGNYALGKSNSEGLLTISYVGRSDGDLKAELIARLDTHKHPHFKFSYASSVKEAFETECNNYHDFTPSENKIHPAKPEGTNLKCPRGDG